MRIPRGRAVACGTLFLGAILLGCSGGGARGVESAPSTRADESSPARAQPQAADSYECTIEYVAGRRDAADETLAMEHRFSFDQRGRLAAERQTLHQMGGATVDQVYERDEHGRVVRVRGAGGTDTDVEVTYVDGDDPTRQVVQLRQPIEGDPSTVVWTYDDRGRVLRSDESRSGVPRVPGQIPSPQVTSTDRCDWAPSGRIAALVHEGQRLTYAYADDGRLTGVTTTFEGGDTAVQEEVVHGEGRVDVWGADDTPAHVRYVGRCEDVLFRFCSPAFAPPPPGGEAPRLPRLGGD